MHLALAPIPSFLPPSLSIVIEFKYPHQSSRPYRSLHRASQILPTKDVFSRYIQPSPRRRSPPPHRTTTPTRQSLNRPFLSSDHQQLADPPNHLPLLGLIPRVMQKSNRRLMAQNQARSCRQMRREVRSNRHLAGHSDSRLQHPLPPYRLPRPPDPISEQRA